MLVSRVYLSFIYPFDTWSGTSDLVTDSTALGWLVSGTKTITVAALNDGSIVTTTHLISIAIIRNVFLPIVLKGN
jgi:hypothetical protein